MLTSNENRLSQILDEVGRGSDLSQALGLIADQLAADVGAPTCKIWVVKRGDICDRCPLAGICTNRQMCMHLIAASGAPSPKNRYRRGRRHGISDTVFSDTDVCDRRPIARWLSYFFWRRPVPRRLNDAPAFIQSSSPHESDVRSHGRSIDPRSSCAPNVGLYAFCGPATCKISALAV